MKIEVLFFAQIREALGVDSEIIDLNEGARVEDIVDVLCHRPSWPAVAEMPLSFAVNEAFVKRDHRLREGDRVAILTPVSGG